MDEQQTGATPGQKEVKAVKREQRFYELSVGELKRDVEAGMTREDMAKKYQISRGNLATVMKAAGLGGKRAPSAVITLVDEAGNKTLVKKGAVEEQAQEQARPAGSGTGSVAPPPMTLTTGTPASQGMGGSISASTAPSESESNT